MAFSFDGLTRKAKDIAALAADKTRDAADQVKVNVAIAGEQREMDKIPEAVKELVEAVNACKARIAELEASREKAEEPEAPEAASAVRTCSVCGNQADSKFCPQCGAPMMEAAAPAGQAAPAQEAAPAEEASAAE